MADRIDAFTVHHEIVVKADDFKSEIESIKKNAKEYAKTMGGIQSDQLEGQIQSLEQAVNKLTIDMKALSENVDKSMNKIKLSQDIIDGYEKMADIFKALSNDEFFEKTGTSVESLKKLFGELTQLINTFHGTTQTLSTGNSVVGQVSDQAKEATKEVSNLSKQVEKAKKELAGLNNLKDLAKARTFADDSSKAIKNSYNKKMEEAHALSQGNFDNTLITSNLKEFGKIYFLFNDINNLQKQYNSRSSNDDLLRNDITDFLEILDKLDLRLDELIADQEQKITQLLEQIQPEVPDQNVTKETQQTAQAVVQAEEAKQDAIKDTNAAMAEQQELASSPLPSLDSSDNAVVDAQKKIQAEIEETNKGIKNQQEWLKILDQSLDDSHFLTNGKREATEQLRAYTQRLADYRLHPDNYAGEQYAEERMITDWWKANQEAIRQGVADSTLTRYKTDISQKDYEDSLAKLEKERAFRLAALEEYSNKKIQLEQEQQAVQAQTSAQNMSNIEQETKAVQENTAAIQQNIEVQQQRTAVPEVAESGEHADSSVPSQAQEEINGMTQLRDAIEAVKKAIGDKTEQFALERDVAASAIFDEVAYLKDLQEAVEKVRDAVAQVDMEKIKTPTTESTTSSAPVNTNTSDESKDMEALWDNIVAVIEAIDAKTKAFQDEGAIVDKVVATENDRLLTLKSTLTGIQTILKDIISKQKSVNQNPSDSSGKPSKNKSKAKKDKKVSNGNSSDSKAPTPPSNTPTYEDAVKAYKILTKSEEKYQELLHKRGGTDAQGGSNENFTKNKEVSSWFKITEQRRAAEETIAKAKQANINLAREEAEYTKEVSNITQRYANVDKVEQQRKVIEAFEILISSEMKYQTLVHKRNGDDKNLTPKELSDLIGLESIRSKANQTISQNTELTDAQAQAQERYNRVVEETAAVINRISAAQNERSSSKWGSLVFDAKDIEDVEKQIKARLSSMNMKQISSLVQSSNGSQFTTKIQTADKQIQKVVYHMEQVDDGGFQVYESITKAGEATSSWDKLVSTIGKKFRDLGAYLVSFASVYQIWDQIKTGYSYVAELDKQLTEMRKVSDESIESLKKYQKETFAVADAVGTTAAQIQASTADYMRLGESLESAAELAKDTNILMNVSEFTDINEATESMIAMKQAYQELTSKEIVDSLNYIGNNFSITTAGLAQALQKSAAALKVSGNDFNETIALITAGNSILQDPDSVANGIRTIAMRLNGTTVDELEELGEDTEGLIETSSKLQETVAALTAVNGKAGISLVDSVGNYNSTFENLLAIADRWEEIGKQDALDGKNRQNALMEALAGEFCLKFVETHFYRTHLIARAA